MFYLTKLVKVIIEYIYIYIYIYRERERERERENQVTSPTMKEKNPNFIRTNNDGPPRNRVKLSSQYLDKAITCVN
jgi:hypothetical protein